MLCVELLEASVVEQAPCCDECCCSSTQGSVVAYARGTARRTARVGGVCGCGAGDAHYVLLSLSAQSSHYAPFAQSYWHASCYETVPYAFLPHLRSYFPLANDIWAPYLLFGTSQGYFKFSNPVCLTQMLYNNNHLILFL